MKTINAHISHICIFNIQIRGHQDKFDLCISQISVTAKDINQQKMKIIHFPLLD